MYDCSEGHTTYLVMSTYDGNELVGRKELESHEIEDLLNELENGNCPKCDGFYDEQK